MLILLPISSIVYAAYQSNSEDGFEIYKYAVYYVTPSIMIATFVRNFVIKYSFFISV